MRLRGGGLEVCADYQNSNARPNETGEFTPDPQSHALLVRFSSGGGTWYERQFPDGSKEVFTFSAPDPVGAPRYFLGSAVDPVGNAAILGYGPVAQSVLLRPH